MRIMTLLQLRKSLRPARPFSTKHFMHVVLKSDLAKGQQCFLRIERELLCLIKSLALKLNIRIQDVVVMSNHIHLSLKISHRRALHSYLRSLSGLIVRKIFHAEKSRPKTLVDPKKFFTGRPFSRVVAGGRKSFTTLQEYFNLNRIEKLGIPKVVSRAHALHRTFAPS